MMKFRLALPAFSRFGGYWLLWIPLFVGSINVKNNRTGLMYSERYGLNGMRYIVIGPWRFTWVKFR